LRNGREISDARNASERAVKERKERRGGKGVRERERGEKRERAKNLDPTTTRICTPIKVREKRRRPPPPPPPVVTAVAATLLGQVKFRLTFLGYV